ncbi:MAG: hypothetical protein L0Z49_10155 [Actinobacteria bacterium]|nr:hypothetical protein [Actinomycetota bacterium]MCI0544789.1 hypothetical protein [Actinomycetota bacterium]
MDVKQAIDDLRRYARLERVLALFCVASPLLMIWADAGGVRDSISAYYSMTANQWFYFPLTAASMLFLVNGFVKQESYYNAWLGVMLTGVVLLNHQDFRIPHGVFAAAFFLGNAAVIAFFSRGVKSGFRIAVLVGVVMVFLMWWPLGIISLFVAEWISLALIAAHFLAASSQRIKYRAAKRGEGPMLKSDQGSAAAKTA